jgi:hypothetical protein
MQQILATVLQNRFAAASPRRTEPALSLWMRHFSLWKWLAPLAGSGECLAQPWKQSQNRSEYKKNNVSNPLIFLVATDLPKLYVEGSLPFARSLRAHPVSLDS